VGVVIGRVCGLVSSFVRFDVISGKSTSPIFMTATNHDHDGHSDENMKD